MFDHATGFFVATNLQTVNIRAWWYTICRKQRLICSRRLIVMLKYCDSLAN